VKNFIIIGFIFVLVGSTQVLGQDYPIEQGRRKRDRINQSIRGSEERARENDRRLDEASRLPVPKSAVMNVDVQIVLSKSELKTFAEAKAAEAKKIVDGEPLWMYVKFKTRLGDYVLTTRSPEDPEKLLYTLYSEVGPRGDVTALNQYSIQFTKEDLAATELRINLAPGAFGRNKSIPVFLMTSGQAKTGVWNNELRLTNTTAVPRSLSDNLASAPVILEFSGGQAKYRRMEEEYNSITLRGSSDIAKLPIPGTFFSEDLRTQIAARLAAEKIAPVKIYFSGDDWQESGSFGAIMKKNRKVFATFTYREGETCFYGVAEIVEDYDFMNSKYGPPQISLQKGHSAQCTEIN